MSSDSFGDRMKFFEGIEAGRRLMPSLPILVRLDGRGFSRFTSGLQRPFDARLSGLMQRVTQYLVGETNARIGYTQSDEITLVLAQERYDSEVFFDGRVQKIVSTLAALASVRFNHLLATEIPEKANRLPTFDCRVWNVPSETEAANTVLWREQDATKNAISMAARHYYPHSHVQGKNGSEMQEMLWQKGVNFNDYPPFFQRGTFIQRRKVTRKFSAEELERLPPMHEARQNPDLTVERSELVMLAMPPFGKVINREDVIFRGAPPLTAEELE